MASPPLYSQVPPSEPSDSSANETENEEDDGFISRPRHSRSHSNSGTSSPPSKRAKYNHANKADGSKPNASTNGSAKPSDPTTSSPLSISILNVEPIDEFIREVADFIYSSIMYTKVQGQVELEAKIGILRDKRTNERIVLPTLTETILPPGFDEFAFESNLSVEQHKHLNQMLNDLMIKPPPSSDTSRPAKIEYAHRYLVDEFYPMDNSGRGRDKVRVTREEETNKVVECVHKVRIGDLNIYSPKRRVDWRISVNIEVPERLPTGTPTTTRRKNRITYSHETSRIDLTQVTMKTSPESAPTVLHELELEFFPSSLLLTLAAERDHSADSRLSFDEAIKVFVNNARILVRNA